MRDKLIDNYHTHYNIANSDKLNPANSPTTFDSSIWRFRPPLLGYYGNTLKYKHIRKIIMTKRNEWKEKEYKGYPVMVDAAQKQYCDKKSL